jgi:hypothetical protein
MLDFFSDLDPDTLFESTPTLETRTRTYSFTNVFENSSTSASGFTPLSFEENFDHDFKPSSVGMEWDVEDAWACRDEELHTFSMNSDSENLPG